MSRKILLVEDDPFLVRVYKLKLEKEGYVCELVTNGVGVLEKVKQWKPDMVLLDLVMPEKDGFTVLKELKNDDVAKKVPVMVLTALQVESDIEQGKKLGADAYLTKANYTFEQVMGEIEKLVK